MRRYDAGQKYRVTAELRDAGVPAAGNSPTTLPAVFELHMLTDAGNCTWGTRLNPAIQFAAVSVCQPNTLGTIVDWPPNCHICEAELLQL